MSAKPERDLTALLATLTRLRALSPEKFGAIVTIAKQVLDDERPQNPHPSISFDAVGVLVKRPTPRDLEAGSRTRRAGGVR